MSSTLPTFPIHSCNGEANEFFPRLSQTPSQGIEQEIRVLESHGLGFHAPGSSLTWCLFTSSSEEWEEHYLPRGAVRMGSIRALPLGKEL